MAQLTEFLHMGGYALYVWGSYGLSLVVMVLLMVLPGRREQQLLRSLRQRQEREANRQ